MPITMTRCPWCGDDPLYTAYHDTEWGVPCHDERALFEFLILEGAQAGLSWITILRKRENYRRAYHGFDVHKIARYGARDVTRLLGDAGIVRNRLKIEASIANARATLELYEQGGTLDGLLWSVVDGKPKINRWQRMDQGPAVTPEAGQDVLLLANHDQVSGRLQGVEGDVVGFEAAGGSLAFPRDRVQEIVFASRALEVPRLRGKDTLALLDDGSRLTLAMSRLDGSGMSGFTDSVGALTIPHGALRQICPRHYDD